MLLNVIGGISLLLGAVFLMIGSIGLLRLPDFFTRLHAASIIDTLGCILIAFGLILHADTSIVIFKLFAIVSLIILAGPVATHALAKAALNARIPSELNKTVE
ncbi:Na(+) H(+) antiporter subunit G [uncultured Candidatus Thioglobus sp.]|nr:Na(+) H(+) antiporter subunit G [uncultured Candidatus Thioglobus sp.]